MKRKHFRLHFSVNTFLYYTHKSCRTKRYPLSASEKQPEQAGCGTGGALGSAALRWEQGRVTAASAGATPHQQEHWRGGSVGASAAETKNRGCLIHVVEKQISHVWEGNRQRPIPEKKYLNNLLCK